MDYVFRFEADSQLERIEQLFCLMGPTAPSIRNTEPDTGPDLSEHQSTDFQMIRGEKVPTHSTKVPKHHLTAIRFSPAEERPAEDDKPLRR